jgi:hypothetical protein
LLNDEVRAWLAERIPEGWFKGPPEIEFDDDELLIVGELQDADDGGQTSPDGLDAARAARIRRFREETREQRMHIAHEAERRFGRKAAWGVSIGGRRQLFTSLSIPVMTRLRLPERQVLDTLVQAGVARSRSEALAWCVRLVGRHEAEWIRELREALVRVNELRRRGPD